MTLEVQPYYSTILCSNKKPSFFLTSSREVQRGWVRGELMWLRCFGAVGVMTGGSVFIQLYKNVSILKTKPLGISQCVPKRILMSPHNQQLVKEANTEESEIKMQALKREFEAWLCQGGVTVFSHGYPAIFSPLMPEEIDRQSKYLISHLLSVSTCSSKCNLGNLCALPKFVSSQHWNMAWQQKLWRKVISETNCWNVCVLECTLLELHNKTSQCLYLLPGDSVRVPSWSCGHFQRTCLVHVWGNQRCTGNRNSHLRYCRIK